MLVDGKQCQAIWRNLSTGQVFVIDQRHLPHSFVSKELTTVDEFVSAISDMIVRGATLISLMAAYGMAVAMNADSSDAEYCVSFQQDLKERVQQQLIFHGLSIVWLQH